MTAPPATPPVTLRAAEGPADMDLIRTMFREYADWLEVDLCFQGFDEELAGLPGKYAPPAGRLLFAAADGLEVGCVGLRATPEGDAEMKRLWVRPEGRGTGAGRLLAHAVVKAARAAGYTRMVLDTFPDRMAAANALYDELGFVEIPAYYENPFPGISYKALDLTSVQPLPA